MMPNHVLFNDIIDEMIDNIVYIKLNAYLNINKSK